MHRVTRFIQERRGLIAMAAAAAASTSALASATNTNTGIEKVHLQEPDNRRKNEMSPPIFSGLQSCSCEESVKKTKKLSKQSLQRRRTIRQMDSTATKAPLESKYIWHKSQKLGEGAYGTVYLATDKATKEDVALKQIPKKYTNSRSFQREMQAMLYIQKNGGHPHLCSLREHFDSPKDYFVILDFVGGGEMFDHLIQNGAYSELDASRLVREVASALNFLHGIGVVHADLKPENLLLTTSRRGDAVVKLADFGSAQLLSNPNDEDYEPAYGAPTPAYSPPESILKTRPIEPTADMWGLGVILFIMLTGAHPYDLDGEASDEEIEERIKDTSYKIPIDDENITGHLSKSSKDLIARLMDKDPPNRLTAFQMLQHPWIRGDTAATTVMEGSDARLSKFRKLKSKLQAKFFESAVLGSDHHDDNVRKTSLMERTFRAWDAKEQGYITSKDIMGVEDEGGPVISMSDFTNLLSDNIKHQHFPAGHVIYREGHVGNHMYLIDSGTIEVRTNDGSVARRGQGDFFGEGALLQPNGVRSATVTCITPVHTLEISREYFDKYISSSETGLLLTLKEKDRIRKRNRAKTILRLQNNLKIVAKPKDGIFFKQGEAGDSVFMLESGKVDILVEGNQVFSAYPGNIFGEYSVLSGRQRNCSAKCVALDGCIAHELLGEHLRKLMETSPNLQASLRELQFRREFKKALVLRLKGEFPYHDPQAAFQAADHLKMGLLNRESIAKLMRELDSKYTDEEIEEIVQTLDLTSSDSVSFEEFKKIFIGDIKTSSSM